MSPLMWELAVISLWMSPLIAALLVARPWLRRWIGGRGMGLVWAVVLLRLLVPVAWTIPQEWKTEVREVVERKEAVLGGKVAEVQGKSYEKGESGVAVDWLRMTGWIWLAGAGGMAGWALLGVVRLRRVRTGEVRDAAVLAAWEGIDARLRGRVWLRECATVSAPALVGWTIWVPSGWRLSQEQWRHVLLHELGHFRRGDLWMQWIGMMVRMVYWWNPLVWLMVRAGEQDREVACDEWVRRQGEEVEAYGGTLVALARWVKGGGVPGAVLMATGRKQLLQRVEAMTQNTARSRWFEVIAGVFVLLGVVAVTAKAEKVVKILDWDTETGWNSKAFREKLRSTDRSRYWRLKEWGGLEVQAQTYKQPRNEAQRLLEKILQRKLSTDENNAYLLSLTRTEAQRALSLLKDSLWFPPLLLAPSGLNKQSMPAGGRRSKMEIARQLRFFAQDISKNDGSKTLWTELLGVSLEVGEMGRNDRGLRELMIEGKMINLMGTYSEAKGYEPIFATGQRWEGIGREGPVNLSSTPLIFTLQGTVTLTVPEKEVAYFLLRARTTTLMVGIEGPGKEEEEKIFPGHPLRKVEPWFLIRVQPIPPEP